MMIRPDDGFCNYDKSRLGQMQHYDLGSDITSTLLGQYAENDIRGRSGMCDNIGINRHDWIDSISRAAGSISSEAAHASKQNKFTLICKVPSHLRGNLFPIFAKALFYLHGIKVKKVDDLQAPSQMSISWKQDKEEINSSSSFLQIDKRSKCFTDFKFQIKGLSTSYDCHRIVLAGKSPFFKAEAEQEKLFAFEEGTDPKLVEFLLDYLYGENRGDVEGLDPDLIREVLKYANLFQLEKLKRNCLQYSQEPDLDPIAKNLGVDGFCPYDKSRLEYKPSGYKGYSMSSDICSTFLDKYPENDIRSRGQVCDILGIKQDSWTKNILDYAKTISALAAKASKENKLTLICEAPSHLNGNLFPIVARALFYYQGIRVNGVDQLDRPSQISIAWEQDNEGINPCSSFLQVDKHNKCFTDFKFQIKGLPNTYDCHRVVLGGKSPFFKGALTGTTPSEMQQKNLYEFEEGTSPEIVEFLLDHLYGENEGEVKSLTLAMEVLHYADFLQLKNLKTQCVHYLQNRLSLKTIESIVDMALYSKALGKACESSLILHFLRKELSSDEVREMAKRLGSDAAKRIDTKL